MKPHVKDILIGVVTGFLANAAGTFLYIFFTSEYDVDTSIRLAIANNFIGKLITLGAIMNLLVFFIFIKKKQYYRARGVLLATIIIAIGLLFLQFL